LSHDGRIGCHTMAVTAAGHAWTSGGNVYGQLDVGDRTNRLGFTQVDAGQLGGARIVMAACGWLHSVVVSAEGRVWTFGRGWSGSLGHNDEQHRLVPTLLAGKCLARKCTLRQSVISVKPTEEEVQIRGKRGRSEKDETTGVRKTKPRTRPTREAASKPKTYAVDSDSLDEEEEEEDAFVRGGGGRGNC